MDAYLDITLLPDPEFAPAMLMNALFGKLHRGLVGQGGNTVEISRHSGMDRRNPDCVDAFNTRHPWSLGSGDPGRNDGGILDSTALGVGLVGGQPIGISFPDVKGMALGKRIRLHGQTADLEGFMASAWLAGMRDHIELGLIGPVPAHAKHRAVRRVQAKSNPERLRRRMMARKGVDAGLARQAIPDSAAEKLRLPYLVLKSQSTGQQFRLFVEHLPVQDQPVGGPFSAYGLSPTATVPWF